MTRGRESGGSKDWSAAIVDAAVALLAAEGPSALTTRRVASEAGTTTMTLYSRFGDKQGIEQAVALEGFRRLGDAMASAAKGRRQPLEAVVRVAQAYRRFALDNAALYGVMFRGTLSVAPDERTHEVAAQAFKTVTECVERYASTVRLTEDSTTIALRVWAMCHGSCSLELDRVGMFASGMDAFFAGSIRSVVRGHLDLGQDPSSRPE